MGSPSNRPPTHPERGIALVSALLVLLLISVVGVTYMTTSRSERAMTSNVHTARASLISADAGVRAAQQVLANTAQARLNTVLATYPGTGPIITDPANLFTSSSFTATSTNPPFTASGTITWADDSVAINAQTFNYRYTITSAGTYGNAGQRQVQSTGLLRVSAQRTSFAQYLIFTDKHTTASGGAIWFTSDASFDGKVHTNGTFRFAYQPEFQDLVTQVDSKAYFYNKGNPKYLNDDHNGVIDVPLFYGGFNRSQSTVTLPNNSFSQQNVALGLSGTTAPANPAINTALGLGSGSSAPPNGIYIVNNGTNVTGGIYVQGNLDRMLATADTVNGRQVYQLTQGGTTKTITVDPHANSGLGSTTVVVGASTTTYVGTPSGNTPNSSLGITYVNGQISDLRGPDRVSGSPPPALLDGQQVLIAAKDDIVIQRDITMHNYNDGDAVLGIYSSGGDVRVGSGAPNDCYLDAYVMATGGMLTGEGAFTVDGYNSGSPRGTFHLRGGVITQYYGAFYTFNTNGTLKTGYARDFRYDRRGFEPPYFPTTPQFAQTNLPTARTLAWKEL